MGVKAVFLDRDGTLNEDRGLITKAKDIFLIPQVGEALSILKRNDFILLVITNQAVLARGLITVSELNSIHRALNDRLVQMQAVCLDGFYYCPHHPQATLASYRQICECRKPKPGLLLKAAQEHGVDLKKSFMVGDRLSDVAAGLAAGCKSLLVKTGCHNDPPIVGGENLEHVNPQGVFNNLLEAAHWIEGQQ